MEPQLIVGAAIFAAFIFLGDLFAIRVNERTSIGVWNIPVIVAVASLGPEWAALASIPSAVFVGWRDPLRTVHEISHNVTIIYLAGMAFSLISAPLLVDDSAPWASILYATLVAGIVQEVSSELINGFLLRVKYNQSFHKTWQNTVQPYLLPEAVNILTAGLAILALVVYDPVAAVVVVAGSIGSLALMYRSREQVKENEELRVRVKSLEAALANSNTAFGTMIIRDLGQRDGYTHRHAAATATYAADLAREMKLDDTHVEKLRMAGLLHNIGLFGLPDEMLLATGRPNSIARRHLDEHPARGEEALAGIAEFEEMASWVRWHHERPDGRGYPDKLRGPWIPLEARILSVAQAYAAMILDQPRRAGMTSGQAREQLSAGLDTEFDGVVVRALLRLLDTESEGYRMADDHRFVFPSPEGGARSGTPEPRRDEHLGRIVPH
ncbi:MAG TPA: HD domain-containing phosphohydrolase [Rubrobacter sp.]|nr:HD domain-containing phosphohydrolase [Rubrobacter sp.]